MEKALYISNIQDLKYHSETYSRIYFGNEFCEELIPDQEELRIMLDKTIEKDMNFSLVTPYVTDYGLKRLIPLLDHLSEKTANHEVIVNDFGVLKVINERYPGLEPVLGRLRNPFIKDKKTIRLSLKYLYYLKERRTLNINRTFLSKNNIRRIDIQNVDHLKLDNEAPDIKISLYYPYNYISTTRYCPVAFAASGMNKLSAVKGCRQYCKDNVVTLNSDDLKQPIYLKGNAYFQKTKLGRHQPKQVDRLVYQPSIPF